MFPFLSDENELILVNAFGRNGMGIEAVQLYQQTPEDLRDQVTHICVLNACSHSALVDEARRIFNEIKMKNELVITVMVKEFVR